MLAPQLVQELLTPAAQQATIGPMQRRGTWRLGDGLDRDGLFWLAVSVGVVLITAVWGGFYSAEARREWFRILQKPMLYPPEQVFGIAWTLLYGLMAVAAWLVGRSRHSKTGRLALHALVLYVLQLVLHVLWNYVFFFAQRFGWAAVVMILLLIVTLATAWLFFRVRPVAGWLFLPTLLWVSFATYLACAIAALHSETARSVARRLLG